MDVMDLIKRHEGCRLHAYHDTLGNATIGFGHMLTPKDADLKSISQELANELFLEDFNGIVGDLESEIDWFHDLDEVRQAVLIDMAFNLGVAGLMKFRRMLSYCRCGDYDSSSKEMLESIWAKQVKTRAIELSEMMRTGQWVSI